MSVRHCHYRRALEPDFDVVLPVDSDRLRAPIGFRGDGNGGGGAIVRADESASSAAAGTSVRAALGADTRATGGAIIVVIGLSLTAGTSVRAEIVCKDVWPSSSTMRRSNNADWFQSACNLAGILPRR